MCFVKQTVRHLAPLPGQHLIEESCYYSCGHRSLWHILTQLGFFRMGDSVSIFTLVILTPSPAKPLSHQKALLFNAFISVKNVSKTEDSSFF